MKKLLLIILIFLLIQISIFSLKFNENIKIFLGKDVQIYVQSHNGERPVFFFGTVKEIQEDYLVLNNKDTKSFIYIRLFSISTIAITERNFNKK